MSAPRPAASPRLDEAVATAILGLDTLWGGDVMNPSGTGRFIADSWFSDAPPPAAYAHPTAAALRASGGVGAGTPDEPALDAYLAAVDLPAALATLAEEAARVGGTRGAYLEGLAECLGIMWTLALARLGRAEPVSYERCVRAVTGRAPEPSQPEQKRATR
ncbi:MAG: hypothetical protein F9K18_06300, partial [Thermoanaerobaculia bacterium]